MTVARATCLVGLFMLVLVTEVAAQPVSVTAAVPASGERETLGLLVRVTGKNFAPGARADFFKSKTTDPAGITVRATRFISATELEATIDIASTAELALFDIRVTNTNGRSGKGSDLFQVLEKGARGQATCTPEPLDTTRFELVTTLNQANGSDARYKVGFGLDVKARRTVLSYATGAREVIVLAVGTSETGMVEIFFLDPDTSAVLDGTAFVPGAPVQQHITVSLHALNATLHAGQLAVGDVNGDGLPDFALTKHNGGDAGALLVARQADGVLTYEAHLLPTPAQKQRFGLAVAMGDLDADGFDEVLVSKGLWTVGKTVEFPKLFVYGAKTGIPALLHVIAPAGTQSKTDVQYGRGLAVADVDNDGKQDVLTGAPFWNVAGTTEAGALLVHLATGAPVGGTAAPLSSSPLILLSPSPARADHFANHVAAGDLDGHPSGTIDALALEGWGNGETAAHVFPGPLMASGQASLPALRLQPRTNLSFGWGTRGAAIADLDANGLSDVVIGAPNAPDSGGCSTGILYVFLAQGTTASGTTGWERLTIQAPSQDADFAGFGWAASVAPGSSPGSSLIIVSEHGRNIGTVVGAGQVYIYRMLP